jgi:WD40 repeat protein/sterol desaturase/sphingolipid hydroxylase (fatty acid hydroxylase superfamily)
MDWMATIGGFWLSTLALLGGLAVAFGVLARLMPCNPGMYWWKNLRAVVADFVYWLVVPLFLRLCRTLLLIAGVALLFGGREPNLLPVRGLPLWQQCVAVLLIQDVMMYWIHRAFHTRPAWKFHAVHHSPTVLDWMSTVRFHPVNSVLEFTLADVAVLLLGFSPQTIVVLTPFNIVVSAMVHANLGWTFGPLRYVFASPVFHRWHHTREAEGLNKNFAPTFPFLDVLFGTFYMPARKRPEQFGNGEAEFPEGFWGQLIYPYRKRAGRQPAAVMLTGVLAVACAAGGALYYRAWLQTRDAQLAAEKERAEAAARAALAGPAPGARPAGDAGGGLAGTALAISADGERVVLGHRGGTVKVCDAATGQEVVAVAGHTGRVNAVAISADGRRVVSGGMDGAVKVWDGASGRELASLAGHKGFVLSVAVSADGGCVVSGGADGTVRVWDATAGREVVSLTGDTDAFPSVAVSADGCRVVAADMATARVWDARTGREEVALKGHTDLVFCTAISPDGLRVVSGSLDGTAKVWDARTGSERCTLTGHTGSVFCVTISPDGRRVFSGSNDGTVKVWDAQTGREELTLAGSADAVTSVAASADGRRIVSGTRDGLVRVWDSGPHEATPFR